MKNPIDTIKVIIACSLERTKDMPVRKERVNERSAIAMSAMDLEMAASCKTSSRLPAKRRSKAMHMALKSAMASVMMNTHSNGFPVRPALPSFDPLMYMPGTAKAAAKVVVIMSPAIVEMPLDIPFSVVGSLSLVSLTRRPRLPPI